MGGSGYKWLVHNKVETIKALEIAFNLVKWSGKIWKIS